MKKRNCIVILLILSLLIPNVGVFSAPTDSMNERVNEAISELMELGILKGDVDGSIRPEEKINRAEFVAIIIRANGLEDMVLAMDDNRVFKDLSDDYWANKYIHFAYKMGFIGGYDNDEFRPFDNITYEQAVKILVEMLGYGVVAQQRGGYPSGYMSVAANIGLTKGISNISYTEEITRATAALLLNNALDVKILEQDSFGDSQFTVKVSDETFLESVLKIKRDEGIIFGSDVSRLAGERHMDEDEVEINGVIYKIGNTKAKDYIGYYVEYYYEEDTKANERILRAIRKQESKNDVLTLSMRDIVSVQDDFTVIYETNNGKGKSGTEKAVLDKHKYVVYNGKPVAVPTKNDFIYNSGNLKLIDNDTDGDYDVVLINAYDNYIVERVHQTKPHIFTRNGKPTVILDVEDRSQKIQILKDGKKINIKDIQPWDVLSIAKSKDEEIITVHIVRDVVEGTVTEFEENNKVWLDNGNCYYLANDFSDNLFIGDVGKFHLNMDGDIQGVEYSFNTGKNYGYFVEVAESVSGLSDRAEFKIFTLDGEMKIFKSADKVSFCGERRTGREIANDDRVKGKPQLITYKLNSNGELITFNLAVDYTSTEEINTGTFTKNYEDESVQCSGGLIQAYSITEDTKIFMVPRLAFVDQEDRYRILDQLDDDFYYAILYDVDEEGNVGAVVVSDKKGEPSVNMKNSLLIIDKITKAINEKGEQVCRIYGFMNNEKVIKDFADDVTLIYDPVKWYRKYTEALSKEEIEQLKKEDENIKALQQGDMILIDENIHGEIIGYQVIFDINYVYEQNPYYESWTQSGVPNYYDREDNLYFAYGRVVQVTSSKVVINAKQKIDNIKKWNKAFPLENASIYVYDMDKKTIELGTPADIEKDDQILLRATNISDLVEIVVLK